MSAPILARLRVSERHGIRRFLYPLTLELDLPELRTAPALGMTTAEGQPVPMQVTPENDAFSRIDFAVSLAPYSVQDYVVAVDLPPVTVNDALSFSVVPDTDTRRSRQERFALSLDADVRLTEVVYDGVSHLRQKSAITRNGQSLRDGEYQDFPGEHLLGSWAQAEGTYADGCDAEIQVELTACKSWATVTHTLNAPKPQDQVQFTLPLAVAAPILTCDFGVGGGISGKLQAGVADAVQWRSEFMAGGSIRWSVATNHRIDYVGDVETAQAYLPQRWFHLLDSGKALAVAVTQVPDDCQEMQVTLTVTGDVTVAFTLRERITGPAAFGVCYHFLNDVPAIAAATNPQSILLPPTVELLPAAG